MCIVDSIGSLAGGSAVRREGGAIRHLEQGPLKRAAFEAPCRLCFKVLLVAFSSCVAEVARADNENAVPAEPSLAKSVASAGPGRSRQTPANPPPSGNGVDVSFAALLLGFAPLDGAGSAHASVFLTQAKIDVHSTFWGVKGELRIGQVPLRSFYGSNVWLQEAEAYAKWQRASLGVGKTYVHFGRPWDDSFYGSILAYDGLKAAPALGASLDGEVFSERQPLAYSFQYFVEDGTNNVAAVGRDTVAAGGRQRDIVNLRLLQRASLGTGRALYIATSAQTFRAVSSTGAQRVTRAEVDAELIVFPAHFWLEADAQDGRATPSFWARRYDGTLPLQSGARYLHAGSKVVLGDWIPHVNVSAASYTGTPTSELMIQGGLVRRLNTNLSLLLEADAWRRFGGDPREIDSSVSFVVDIHWAGYGRGNDLRSVASSFVEAPP